MKSAFSCPTGILRLFLFLCFAVGCFGQFNSGVQGNITDPSGAGVAKASVTLRNTATNVSQETTADNAGNYKFISLAPGSYEIVATAAGFAKTNAQITLTTGQNLNVPIALTLANASTSVVVTAAAPVLDTADTRNQETIETKELSAVPLGGRSMLGLATLAPGVTGRGLAASSSPGSAADNFSTEQTVDANANGQNSNANLYIVDGLDVTSNIRPGVVNLSPNPDSIQEETTEVNTFSTEYGRGASITYRMTTKSGSDQFHGLASDYFTYQNWTAGTEFTHKYLPFHSNNFSGNVGGPIIPHKSLFFFFGIEALRSLQSVVNSVTYEDPAFTAFAQQNFPNTLGTQLLSKYKPTGATTTGISQTAAQYFPGTCGTAATFLLPCSTPVIDKGVQSASNIRDGTQYNGRIDKYFSRDRLYGVFFLTRLNTGGPNIRPAFSTTNNFLTDTAQGNWTHTFSPSTLNELSFAYLRVEGYNNITGDFTVPSVSVNGISGFGTGFAQGDFVQKNYHWRDVLTHIQDTHTIRLGYDGWQGQDLAYFANVHKQPSFQFNDLIGLATDKPYTEGQLSYNPVTGQAQPGQYGYQSSIFGIFAQDTWKARPNLTLTYGLRWDNFGNPATALKGTVLANFHLGAGTTFNQQVVNGYMQQQNHVLNNPLWYEWSPRIGIAWDPTSKGDWVIRAGFGEYHDMPTLGNMENGLNSNPPGFVTPTFYNDGSTAPPIFALGSSATSPAGFPYPALVGKPLSPQGGLVGQQLSVGGVDVNLQAPVTLNYTATVEHKLIANLVASIGYSGSLSYNLINNYGSTTATAYGSDLNRFSGDLIQHNSTTPTRLNQSFGSITYQTNQAEARYNALITDLRGRLFKDRVFFDVSYSHSRAMDDANYYPVFSPISQYYAPSNFDAPDRFSALWSYAFPNLRKGSGLVGRVVSGWSISGTISVQNGSPYTVYTSQPFKPVVNASGAFAGYQANSGDFNADGVNYDYPNVSTYQIPNTRAAYLNGVFASGIISLPTFGTGEGNEHPNQYRNPGFFQMDASLSKDTRISERVNLQLRFEFYNILNHPNLQGVDSNLADGNFGRVTAQYAPRSMQVAGKITF